ncbi:TMT1 Trans-aconitate 3-methyltransferase [Candida maltosa Xu316]
MIAQCNSQQTSPSIEFKIGTAEQQPDSIRPDSVDLITGAECCHWVQHDAFFKESARVLKPNGTLAYWFYKDPVFIGHPKANEIYTNYTYNSSFDTDPDSGFEKYMGPYYQQPGHDYLRTLMKEIEVPTDLFYDVVRHEYISERDGVPKISEDPFATKTPLFIKKTITMKWFLDYVKSWSAYHNFMTANGGEYDVAEKFVAELKEAMNWNDDTKIDVIWDTVYTFARKK